MPRIDDEDPQFWACDVAPGGSVTQRIPKGTALCLTGVGLGPDATTAARSTLWAASGDSKAVLANLTQGHACVRLGQPFSGQVTFSAVGPNTLHLSGFCRGALPSRTVAVGQGKAAAAKAAKGAKAAAADDKDEALDELDNEDEDEDEDEGEGEEMDLEEMERVLQVTISAPLAAHPLACREVV